MKYLLFGFLCLNLLSCSTFELPKVEEASVVFNTQAEAGRVRISQLPAIPWTDVSEKLQPTFTLKNADQVLPLVLPNTTASEYVFRSSQAGGIGFNLTGPVKAKSSTFTSVRDLVEDETTSATDETVSTRTLSPAGIPTVAVAPSLGGSTFGQTAEFKPGFDPSLSYRAAAALYQEIQLLNTYLSASLTNDDKVPYLFRLQVTVDPSTRGQPINIDSRIWIDNPTCRPKGKNWLDLPRKKIKTASCNVSPDQIEIIPILIAENGERAAGNRLVEAASQFESSLSALIANQGLGAEFEKLKSELNGLRGSDYNSLLNISLNSSKELLLSIGASYSPTYGLELRDRTYDISFLVLLPRQVRTEKIFGQPKPLYGVNADYQSVEIYESARFINARSGKTLPLISEEFLSEFTQELEEEMMVFRVSEATRDKVRNFILSGEIEDALNLCADGSQLSKCKTIGNFRSLYDKLKSHETVLLPNKAKVDIPKQRRILPTPQSVYAVDKTSVGITATVIAPKGFQLSEDFTAMLIAENKDASKPKQTSSSAKSAKYDIVFPARSISLDNQGQLTLKFPSLADAGISAQASKAKLLLGFSDLPSDNIRKARVIKDRKLEPELRKKLRQKLSTLHAQAKFELGPGSERHYPIVFDKKNTSKPVIDLVFKASMSPKSPTVSVDDKNSTEFRLVTVTNTTKVAVPVRVTIKNGTLRSVTLAGTTLKATDATKLPVGWNKPVINKTSNSFQAAHNNGYDVTIQGVTKDMEIEVEIQQLKRDGTPDTTQKKVIKFKTAK